VRYTSADGRRSERTLHPYGLVAHEGRWYLTGADPAVGEDRTLRLDRVVGVRTLPGAFEPPAAVDPAERLLHGLATAPYRHLVVLRVRLPAERIHLRLPASVAVVQELPAAEPEPEPGAGAARWSRVELRVDRLDWLPAVLASLDAPFAVEEPAELRTLVAAFAERLAESAARVPD
ncbi:WYL domain-containing protein, partial [Kitasatospora purpeofusca]|uniref:WYL domain-containing protein n=1 Tax=Kitasatospora purpeofusca TaxID=67352 RepID=UPI00367F10A2